MLLQQTQQTQLKPGFLFVLMNPAKLGKLGSRTQLTWVTCSLGSPRLAGFRTQLKPRRSLTWVKPSYQYQGHGQFTKGSINVYFLAYMNFLQKCAQLHGSALQIRVGQWSITASLWPLTAHIYHVMIIVSGGFSKKFFSLLFPRNSFE